jgi:hypothetical protein
LKQATFHRTALAAALALAACVAPSPSVADAMRRGRDDALRDIESRRPRVAFIGRERPGDGPLDPEAGLVRLSVGCCKTRELLGYRDAYNDAIDEARAAGRLEGMSLAHKATTRAAVEALFAASRPTALASGAPGVESPGARFVVDIGPGAAQVYRALWSTDRTTGVREELRFLGGDRAIVLFSADGTTLLVRDDAARVYATIDLPSRLVLQAFPDAERER